MTRKKQVGFSLLETLVALAVLFAVGGIVMTGMVQLMKTQGTIANRTDMHTSVRSATELLQQEIGQAGKVSLGAPADTITLGAAVTTPGSNPVSLASSSSFVPAPYVGEVLTIDVGSKQETITVGGTASAPTATFAKVHAQGAPVFALGAFATGVVPPGIAAPATTCVGASCGSSPTVLKLYGDINGDGKMMYVEYTCIQGTASAPGALYRHQMPYDQATAKTASNDPTMILLSNVLANPKDAGGNIVPCFAYQTQTLGSGTCVTNVAVTLTVQTQNIDPQTRQLQTETKALLNVGPRNIVEVYGTANLVDPTRAQPMPATVSALLP
jgi:type II secretory pathway pseudopilin PulG